MNHYITKFKDSQIYLKILTTLLIWFLFSLFFPIRHVFTTPEAFLTGDYSDFTSFSLYLSDILLFLLALMIILPRGRKIWLKIREKGLRIAPSLIHNSKFLILVTWLILAFFIHFGLNTRLNAYFLIRWFELIVAYETFKLVFSETGLKKTFLSLFVWFCSSQSLIALAQFYKQSSLGLYKLGESHLSSIILGVAKIVSGETAYIRGYGTFPHPNPLSAFLVTGILIIIYLLLNSLSKKAKISYSILLFLNILGLTVTFSRGAYLALAAGLVIFFGYQIVTSRLSTNYLALSTILISILVSFLLFKPFLLTRATFSDQSTIDRKFYDDVGVKMAQKNPIFGIGMGEGVLHMEQYSNKNLEPWQKQPPHNYFIMAAAELGLPGALILLWIFLFHLLMLIKKLKSNFNPYLLTLTSIFCAFLLLMQFDHYFYTLQQTQMLLWILLALIASETKNPIRQPAKGDS